MRIPFSRLRITDACGVIEQSISIHCRRRRVVDRGLSYKILYPDGVTDATTASSARSSRLTFGCSALARRRVFYVATLAELYYVCTRSKRRRRRRAPMICGRPRSFRVLKKLDSRMAKKSAMRVRRPRETYSGISGYRRGIRESLIRLTCCIRSRKTITRGTAYAGRSRAGTSGHPAA
jgi:hypothetical protein